jgi:hypothetical protein
VDEWSKALWVCKGTVPFARHEPEHALGRASGRGLLPESSSRTYADDERRGQPRRGSLSSFGEVTFTRLLTMAVCVRACRRARLGSTRKREESCGFRLERGQTLVGMYFHSPSCNDCRQTNPRSRNALTHRKAGKIERSLGNARDRIQHRETKFSPSNRRTRWSARWWIR